MVCKTIFVVLVVLVCFSVRAVLFAWHSLTGQYFEDLLCEILYPWAFYLGPEIISGVSLLFLMSPSCEYACEACSLPVLINFFCCCCARCCVGQTVEMQHIEASRGDQGSSTGVSKTSHRNDNQWLHAIAASEVQRMESTICRARVSNGGDPAPEVGAEFLRVRDDRSGGDLLLQDDETALSAPLLGESKERDRRASSQGFGMEVESEMGEGGSESIWV